MRAFWYEYFHGEGDYTLTVYVQGKYTRAVYDW